MTAPVRTIVRYAREDQHPEGTDLRQAARDSVIRYALRFGLRFDWHHDQAGVLWDQGGYRQRLDVRMWRSEAVVTGRVVPGRIVTRRAEGVL